MIKIISDDEKFSCEVQGDMFGILSEGVHCLHQFYNFLFKNSPGAAEHFARIIKEEHDMIFCDHETAEKKATDMFKNNPDMAHAYEIYENLRKSTKDDDAAYKSFVDALKKAMK